MVERLRKIQYTIKTLKLDALLVTSPVNIRYLTGFTGDYSSLIVPVDKKPVLFTDFRYIEQAKNETSGVKIKKIIKDLYLEVFGEAVKLKIKKLGFESKDINYEQYQKIKKTMKTGLVPTTGLLEKQRTIKQPGELVLIKKAVEIAETTLNKIMSSIKAGVTEEDLASEFEYQVRKNGAESVSFDSIVAIGERASMPHARPTIKKIKKGDLVLIDCGAKYRGYCSDITRCFNVGKAKGDTKKIFSVVKEAQRIAFEMISEGVSCKSVDKAARDFIDKQGYKNRFGHSLGHGVGLDVHESPSLSSRSEQVIEKGMVFTVEPGIYIQNKIGIRNEDMVYITETGSPELLTTFPRELIEL